MSVAFEEDVLVEQLVAESAVARSITAYGRCEVKLSELVRRAGDWRWTTQDEVTCVWCREWTLDYEFVADDVPLCGGCQQDLVIDDIGSCSGCSSTEGDRAEWDRGVFLCGLCVAKVVAAETGGEVVSR